MPKVRDTGDRAVFWCPGCDRAHVIRYQGVGTVWHWNGSRDKPTISPSILSNAPGPHHYAGAPICHSFVKDGQIQFLDDSTHDLHGQTVDLPEWPED